MCNDPSPAGSGRRRPRALARRCGTRSRACALSAGCGAPGAVPALRLYRACHLSSRVQGRATAPPSLRAQGKMIPRPSGQKQPRDSGSRMNLGRDHTGRASFVLRCSLLVSSTPQPGISGLSFLAFRFCVLVDTATAGPSGGPALETAQRETSCSKQGCSDRRGFFTVDLGGGRPSAQGLSAFVSLDIREG